MTSAIATLNFPTGGKPSLPVAASACSEQLAQRRRGFRQSAAFKKPDEVLGGVRWLSPGGQHRLHARTHGGRIQVDQVAQEDVWVLRTDFEDGQFRCREVLFSLKVTMTCALARMAAASTWRSSGSGSVSAAISR
jgi:hypothetical protein